MDLIRSSISYDIDMTHAKFDDINCSIANSLEIIGEGWTILILREAFFGSSRFEDFQQHLGIARNILTTRLKKLTEHGVLKRIPIKEGAKRHQYKLTSKGRALYPTLIALSQWGDAWLEDQSVSVQFIERDSGQNIADVTIQNQQGKILDARDLAIIPGPAATTKTKKRLNLLEQAWQKHNQIK